MIERLKMIFKMGMFDEDIIVITKKGCFCNGKTGLLFANLYGILSYELGEDKVEQMIVNYKNLATKLYENTGKTTDSQEKE